MAKQRDEDLFAKSTMTFGEHLEELRKTLILALGGLMLGFCIGLMFAPKVVDAIKLPLKKALEQFYIDKALHELEMTYEDLDDDITTDITNFVQQKQFVPDEIYIELAELTRLSRQFDQQEQFPEDSNVNLLNNTPSENDTLPNSPGPHSPGNDRLPAPSASMVHTRIWRPLDATITTLNAQEAFMIYLKAGLVAGIVLSSPWMFWHIWTFVAAGLYGHEKRYVYIFLPFSLALFLSGVALAYFFVFEPVLNFLLSFNRTMDIEAEPRISEWLSFVLFLPLGFGISFQLPLVMLFLERIGVFTIESYLTRWRIAILVIFTTAMFLTPADPMSMLLMAVPLTLLYFGGVLLCKWMPRLRSPLEPPDETI